MKITILDDWFDSLRSLPCFKILESHDVTVWTDHVQESDVLVERLQNTDCLVLFRERTKIAAELLNLCSSETRLPLVPIKESTKSLVIECMSEIGLI